MALSVSVAKPTGSVSVSNGGNPGSISGVSVANPAGKVSVVPNYGLQGSSYSATPQNITVGGAAPVNAQVAATQAGINQGQSAYQALLSQYQKTLAGLSRQPTAPVLNFAAVNAQARSAAENAVNPYYTKQLNDFLSQQATQKQTQEAQTQTNIQNLQDQLKQSMQASDISKQRTGEDVAQNQANINTQADQFQTDTGQQFASDRVAQADLLARSGLTGGLGAQQAEASQQARNTSEQRQTQQFQQQRQAQELFKTRTFEDLARSGELATQAEAKGEKQANFDLNSYIQNQGFDLKAKQQQLEQSRQADLAQKQEQQKSILVQQFVNSIANPLQRQAAISAYGRYL